ncbi:MAG: hypothetical protein ACT4NV_04900 [Rhodoferax sp.]
MPLSTHHRFSVARRCAALVLLGALWMPAMAAPDAAFDAAMGSFVQAQGGQSEAIERASAQFVALAQAEPANPVLQAYAGASTAMRATATWLPWKKLAYAEDGLSMLDKALASLAPAHDAPQQRGVPGSLETRFVAANTFLAAPGFMNRQARGAKLLGEVLQHPGFASAPLEFRGAVWMRAARWAAEEKRIDDARRYLDLVVQQQAPQAEAAKAQRAALQG